MQMRFLQLTDGAGDPCIVRSDLIYGAVLIRTEKGIFTSILTIPGVQFLVKESVEDIDQLLSEPSFT